MKKEPYTEFRCDKCGDIFKMYAKDNHIKNYDKTKYWKCVFCGAKRVRFHREYMKKPTHNKKLFWGVVGPRGEIYPSYIHKSKLEVKRDIDISWPADVWEEERKNGYEICQLEIRIIE